jgi:hypothetical protein
VAGEWRAGFGADRLDHRRAEVDADVGGLVRGKDAGPGMFDPSLGDLFRRW